MNNRRKYLLILWIFISYGTQAQDLSIVWGDMVPKRGSMLALLPASNDEFYALRWSGSRILGSYKVSRHEGFELKNSGKLKMLVDYSIASFEDVRVINDKLTLFLSDKKDGKNLLYMKVFNDSIEPVGKDILLASYEMIKGHSKGWFKIIESRNKEYFAVLWEIPAKGDNRDRYGFKIFDKELNEINDGEYPIPFDRELSEIHAHHISDKGDYFLSITEYKEGEGRGFRNKLDFKAVHIFHIAEDGLQDFTLELNGKRVEAMAMTSDTNNIFTITGIFGNPGEYGVKGVFYQRMDLNNGEILSEGFRDFDKDFITLGWTEKEKKRAKRREERGKGEPQLYNFKMKEAVIMPDGSIVGTMEQYYIQTRTYTDSRTGQSSTTYYYYYNDIICYKINTDGEFNWLDKIRKYQVSTNDGGPYSSYSTFVNNNKIYFVFNDSSDNYDEKGSFLDPEKIEMTNYSKRKNVVALASIDLETGEQARQTMFGRSQVKTIAVPKLFCVNKSSHEVLLYTLIGNKEKFGKIIY